MNTNLNINYEDFTEHQLIVLSNLLHSAMLFTQSEMIDDYRIFKFKIHSTGFN